MQTTPDKPDKPDMTAASDRRRIVRTVLASLLLPLAVLAIGSTSHPELAFVLIAVAVPVLAVIGQIYAWHTREGTDERAKEIQRRAAAFSWQVTATVLAAVLAWVDIRHGIQAAEPYMYLSTVLITSYAVPLLWRRWRGF